MHEPMKDSAPTGQMAERPAKRPGISQQAGIALFVAAMGAAFTFAIALNLLVPVPYYYIGQNLYDVYAQALLGGHLNLPVRYLKLEGHIIPDGTGYLYYGLGPLLTRLPFLPFVDLPTMWIPAASIWFWSVLGCAAYHRAFWLALAKGCGGADRIGVGTSALLAFAVWFGSPGTVLVGAAPVFREPIAMAYALCGGFVLVIAMVAFGRLTLERALIPLAVLAGVTVHARPHLAAGLYLAVCVLALTVVAKGGWPRWRRAGTAMLVLGLSGAALLAMNQIRFGDYKTSHGSLTDGYVEYSSIYWGLESKDGPRARTYTDEGPFNARRIIPNAMIYLFAPPSSLGVDPIIDAMRSLHARMIAPMHPLVIADPSAGLVFMWPLWCVLAVIGLRQREVWRIPVVPVLAGVTIGALLMMSYLTITIRYHMDLWAMLALPAVFGTAALARKLSDQPERKRVWVPILLALVVVSGFVSVHKMLHSRLITVAGIGPWPAEFCLKLTRGKGFDQARSREICSLDAHGNDLL